MRIFSTSENKRILIIGGTGTLGRALLDILTKDKKNEITVLSREELKQKETAKLFPTVKYFLADVRDYESLKPHFIAKDTVFHLAAMKHVEMAEANPEESIKINLLGSVNVAKLAIECQIDHCVLSSTDKAVLPINTYGMCKALSEQYFFSMNQLGLTHFSVFRWGNVLGSRGSAIHSFLYSLKKEKTIYITDPRMTRFWIDIKDAAKFMNENYQTASKMAPTIPQMKAMSVVKVADLCAQYLGVRDYKVVSSGIRPGEKLHECIYSDHDYCIRSDNAPECSGEEILKMIEGVIS